VTLVIAVSDVDADRELIDSARGLAAATGWDVCAVHVREAEWSAHADGVEGMVLTDLVGDAAEELGKLLARADVDCVAFGLRTNDDPGLGHVAEALLGSFSAPLLLVRPGMRPLTSLQRLLVPLEGTPSSSAAMLYAEEVLCRPQREIVMLHVATGKTPAEAGSLAAPRFIDQEQYEWSDWQDEFSMRFSQCAHGARHRVSVRVGEPASTIVVEARAGDAELIVLSWKGTFAAGHGRIVRRLLEMSPCPLLVVPADGIDGLLARGCSCEH
jgi:nucleotide-binding universal stress UspA family protein